MEEQYWQSAEFLELALARRCRDQGAAKVISVSCVTAGEDGGNYCSTLTKARLSVLTGAGQQRTKDLVIKSPPISQIKTTFVRDLGLFRTEIMMYREVLPAMEQLMLELKDTELLWPECIAVHDGRIILEDLQATGFALADRSQGLDLSRSMLVARSLARFHGVSAVLAERGLLDTEVTQACYIFAKADVPVVSHFLAASLSSMAEVIKSSWGSQWSSVGDKIAATSGDVVHQLARVCARDEGGFNVLNHGDPWVNNMLFKVDLASGAVQHVRFIDFQAIHFNSPTIDLTYFIYTSLKEEVRANHYHDLLKAYHDSLTRTLKWYRYGGSSVPSLEALEAEMEKRLLLGLVVSCTVLSVVMADPADALDMEALIKDNKDNSNARFTGANYTQRMKGLLAELQGKGVV